MLESADVVVIGAGPGGMQAAIDLAGSGIDTLLVDRDPGNPEAPEGCVTVPFRSSMFGEGPCGTPPGREPWEARAECPLRSIVMGGPTVLSRFDSDKDLGYNFTRGVFWQLMLDAAKQAGASIERAVVTGAQRTPTGITLQTTAGPVSAKAVIHAAGARGDDSLPQALGIGVPPKVHGVYGTFTYDGEWAGADLNIVWHQKIVPHGYFWAAVLPASKAVSVGILNETPIDPETVYKFTSSDRIPGLKEVAPEKFELGSGILGAVAHMKGNSWPVVQTAPRVISIGEAAGAIASYIYEGIFESRFQAKAAARVLSGIHRDGAWDNAARYKAYETEWQELDEKLLHFTRQNHHGLYHSGAASGMAIIDAYCKALGKQEKVVVDSLLDNYLKLESMSTKYLLSLAGAVLGNVPLASKLGVSAALVAAQLQK